MVIKLHFENEWAQSTDGKHKCRKDLNRGAQFETMHRVVSNSYNKTCPPPVPMPVPCGKWFLLVED